MSKLINFEIILGTYEEFIVGYRFNSKENEISQSFASHSHSGSIRCVAHSGHFLATGGADDRIVVHDLKSRMEHCMLNHHNGTVNCLQFTEGHTHLISGGSDGMLAIVRVGNWQIEKLWEKAHKGASIIDIAVHSSNKLALTLGADCTLRTWNLIKGRQAYVINLNSKSKDPKSLQFIKWAPDGIRFALCGGHQTDIWSIDTGGIIKPIDHENKISHCLFYDDDNLIIGFENGDLNLLNLENGSKKIQAHTTRIKAIDICKGYVITCSSDGEIKVWNKMLEEVAMYNTGCRHTCISVVLPTWIKKEENEEDEEENIENESTNEVEKIVSGKKSKRKEQVQVIVEDDVPKKKNKKFKSKLEIAIEGRVEVSKESDIVKNVTHKKKKKMKK